jgi:pilus assembly protein CpaC
MPMLGLLPNELHVSWGEYLQGFARSRKKRGWWAAGLCAASFVAGQALFGDEWTAPKPAPNAGVLDQYLKAKGRLSNSTNEAEWSVAAPSAVKAEQQGQLSLGLKPAAVEVVTEMPGIETKRPATDAKSSPGQTNRVGALTGTALSATADSEASLPPIIPAWAMPRPTRKPQPQGPAPQVPPSAIASPEPRQLDAVQANNQRLLTSEPTAGVMQPTASAPKFEVVENPAVAKRLPSILPEFIRPNDSARSATATMPAQKQDNSAPPEPEPLRPASAPVALLPSPAASTPMVVPAAAPLAKPQSSAPSLIAHQIPPLADGQTKADAAAKAMSKTEPAKPALASSPPEQAKPIAKIAPAGGTTDNKAAVKKADFESGAFAIQPPPPHPLVTEAEDQFGVLPADSPFEAIRQSGAVRLRVRRSILLRTKVDIYRTAIVDDAVCDIVQFTPREVSIIGRSVGTTHVTFWFDDPAMTPLTYLVEVSADPQQIKQDENKYELLQNVINEMFPDSKVHLVLIADKLLVKGQAKDSEEAAQIMTIIRTQSGVGLGSTMGGLGGGMGLAQGAATPVLSMQATGGNPGPAYQVINMLRVPGVQQVALKVKIAELNRSAARGFGLDVNGVINFSDSTKGTQLFLASLLNGSNSTNTTGNGGTSFVTSFSGQEISVGLRYLQERGVIRLLSEPTLVTLSGRPATFVAGGEFAVPTIVGNVGLNAVTTDFRAFGAIISFLPTIVDKDRVRLQVAPEFSQINNSLRVNNTPGLNVRAATTTVELREGQTLAIAGLLEDTYKATTVGDLPGLAHVFGRRDAARAETELIILVTPELVHPMEPEEVPPLPGFDVTEPNGSQFFLHGQIEGNPTMDHRSTVWPRLRRRYGMGGPAMTSGPFGHGQ